MGGYPRGTPSGYPLPGLTGGYLRWGTPIRVPPWPGLMGGTQDGGPLFCFEYLNDKLASRYIESIGDLYLTQHWDCKGGRGLDLAGVPPPPSWTWPGTPLGVERQIDGWTDTCQNITFPRTTYVVGNETWLSVLTRLLEVCTRCGSGILPRVQAESCQHSKAVSCEWAFVPRVQGTLKGSSSWMFRMFNANLHYFNLLDKDQRYAEQSKAQNFYDISAKK